MSLGKTSSDRLAQAHPELQQLFHAVAQGVDRGDCRGVSDIAILCSFRGQADQDEAYRTGRSKKRWPESGHNKTPARAVDAAPYPTVWQDKASFRALQGYVRAVAVRLGIKLKPMIEWDLPHYELRDPTPPPPPRLRKA